jgi:LAO/AO transport system kinase
VSRVDVASLEQGLLAGQRGALSRAITLIESNAVRHQEMAEELLDRLMPRTGGSMRVGITGAPGAGKSTFIERLGTMLTGRGHRVAVLAVDPSSGVSGGSIMGDKTRMETLSVDPNAFVRPSPSAGSLGGVASKTRESMLACEAAGFDVVLIETVGVGQSETAVADMTDFYLALMIPGAGDELQGIKRGLLELADMIAVNKSDGEMLGEARRALATYRAAVHMAGGGDDWEVPVVACSAHTGDGIDDLWDRIAGRIGALRADGRLGERRRGQMLRWMWSSVDDRLRALARSEAAADPGRTDLVGRVERGAVLPPIAARAFVCSLFASAHDSTHSPVGVPIGASASSGPERGAS